MTSRAYFLPTFPISTLDGLPTVVGRQLSTKLSVRQETWQLFDTTDRRLWRRDLVLLGRQGHVTLHHRAQYAPTQAIASAIVDPAIGTIPWFWPTNALRDQLLPVIKMRALIPALTMELKIHDGVVRDDQEKALVHVSVMIAHLDDGQVRSWLELQAIKGYEPEQERIAAKLHEAGWSAISEPPFVSSLDQRCPQDEPTPAMLWPDPGEAAGVALTRYLATSLARLPGLNDEIVADIDTEALHQQRVLLRRVRSLLRHLRSALASAAAERLSGGLRELARCSNRVRDLDVQLLDGPNLMELVPTPLHAGINDLLATCREERREAFITLSAELQQRGKTIITELTTLVEQIPTSHHGPDWDVPIADLVRVRLWKSYRRLVETAAQLGDDHAADEVHQVRIRAKRLRYLLDAFGHVVVADHPDELAALVGQLRSAQDVLGDYNDTAVQMTALFERIQTGGPAPRLIAMGAVIGALHTQQAERADQLKIHFADLAGSDTRSTYKRLGRNQSRPRPAKTKTKAKAKTWK